MKKLIVFAAALLIVLGGCSGNMAKSYIVNMYVGEVAVSTNGGLDWFTPYVDMELWDNARIRTRGDSYCELTMPERGTMRISYDSDVTLKELTRSSETITVDSGTVAVNVDEKLKDGETFRVETSAAVAAIRGTEFVVDAHGDSSSTIVRDGIVSVQPNIDLTFIGDEEVREAVEGFIQISVTRQQGLSVSIQQANSLRDIIVQSWNAGVTLEQLKEIIAAALRDLGLEPSYMNEDNVKQLFSCLMEADRSGANVSASGAADGNDSASSAQAGESSTENGVANNSSSDNSGRSAVVNGSDRNTSGRQTVSQSSTGAVDNSGRTVDSGSEESDPCVYTYEVITENRSSLVERVGTVPAPTVGADETVEEPVAAATTTTTTVRQSTATTVRQAATTTTVRRTTTTTVRAQSTTTTTTVNLDDLESLGLNIRE